MSKRYICLKVFSMIVLVLASASVFGQKKNGIEYSGFFDSYYFRGPLNISGGGGLTFYRGDICNFTDCNSTTYFFSLGASYQVWPRTYFGADVSYVQLGASTDTLPLTSFSLTGIQVDAYAKFLILDKHVTRHSQLRQGPFLIRPYITAGIGTFYTMDASLERDTLALDETESAGFSQISFTVPVGLGFQIWLSHRISIMPELTYRFAFTDFLDGVELASDDKSFDGYAALGLKVQYTPTAKRVRKKKKKLLPPDQYDGPKGTDYPRKREEPEPKRNPYAVPDDGGQDGGGWDDGGGDQTVPEDNGGTEPAPENNGGEDDNGGWDTGGDENQTQPSDGGGENSDDWGW